MRRRVMAGFALASAIARLAAAETERSPLHGSLVPGAHAVGFAIVQMTDPTRPVRPPRGIDGRMDAGDRSRRIAVHVWYPSASSSSARMKFADIVTAHLAGRPAEELRRREADLRRFVSQFGEVPDATWTELMETPLLARRDAAPAPGRFPLIVGQLRPTSTTVTNEYLASHGFVVAMTHGDDAGAADPGAGLDVATRDMELAIAELRKQPYVDAGPVAALGFSGAGFSQLLLAMRHPDVAAVCDLESAIFDDRMMWPLQRGWGYDVAALRVPFLHTYGVPLSARESRIEDFERMRYSTRYRYLVDAPGLHHWDFATEGMAASTILRNRGENGTRLRQAFETTNRYVLAFFNAYIKDDRAELAFLRRDPAANGAPAGLATIRELPSVRPAPTSEELYTLISTSGIARALAEFDDALKRDPQAALFREDRLNALGYRLLRGQRGAEAVAVLRRALEMFPGSSNAYDSLGEALETTGARAEALEVTRRGLQVLEKQTGLSEPNRKQMEDLLRGRLKRLS